MEAIINRYRIKMSQQLPKKDDDLLLKCHKLAVETATNYPAKLFKDALRPNKTDQLSGPSMEEAIGKAFMDIIDQNWKKCEEICCNALEGAKNKVFPVEAELNIENYWTLIERVNAEYNDEIGESLRSKMLFKRLEHLDSRQDTDFKILILEEKIQKQAFEAGANAGVESGATAGTDGDVSSDALTSACVTAVSDKRTESSTIEKRFETELKLRMTWGRILIFWRYWVDCRKESIELLKKILVIIKDNKLKKKTSPVEVTRKKIDGFSLLFVHLINKDFSCYKVLLRKLTEFQDLITYSEYLDGFGVESKDLFFNISSFQTDISVRQSDGCRGFEICKNIIDREQKGLGVTAKLIACTSRPLLHLKDLLRKLSNDGGPDPADMKDAINDLQQEEMEVSRMFPDSQVSLLDVTRKISDETKQLRSDIDKWLPKRIKSIRKMKEIIKKLNKTASDVAITQTVSSSVGIVGGAIAIVGLILASFTFGASLIPTAIAAGVVSGLGALTAIGATVTEIVIAKDEMEKATACIEEDKVHFMEVAKGIHNLNRNSTMFLRYIPQDELESFISAMTDPQLPAVRSSHSSFPGIAINTLRFGSFIGKAVAIPVTRMIYSGTIAASMVVVMTLAQSVAFIGLGLDIANLVLASVKLGQGAKSENAKKLEDAVNKMEKEKKEIEKSFHKMS